jgi:hypothetical protein
VTCRAARRGKLLITPIAAAATALAMAGCADHSGVSGPWKIVLPRVLIGLPQDTRPANVAAEQEGISSEESLFSLYRITGGPDPGKYTSAFARNWDTQNRQPGAPSRYVIFVGFNGTFKTSAAFSQLENLASSNPGGPDPFRKVAAGPHGGLMACEADSGAARCVWASPTTIGDVTIADTSGELTRDNGAATAVEIRDVLETGQ